MTPIAGAAKARFGMMPPGKTHWDVLVHVPPDVVANAYGSPALTWYPSLLVSVVAQSSAGQVTPAGHGAELTTKGFPLASRNASGPKIPCLWSGVGSETIPVLAPLTWRVPW